MKTNTEILAEFDKTFFQSWDELGVVGTDGTPEEIKNFLTTALNQRTEDIVGMLKDHLILDTEVGHKWNHREGLQTYRYELTDEDKAYNQALTDITNKIKALYGENND